MSDDVFRILYKSDIAIAGSRREIEQVVDHIVTLARGRNAEMGITGALIVLPEHFVQALEGPQSSIEEVFESICLDPRHHNVKLVEVTDAPERTFGPWSMVRVPDDFTDDTAAGPREDVWLTADMDAAQVLRAMREALHRNCGAQTEKTDAARRRFLASIRPRSSA